MSVSIMCVHIPPLCAYTYADVFPSCVYACTCVHVSIVMCISMCFHAYACIPTHVHVCLYSLCMCMPASIMFPCVPASIMCMCAYVTPIICTSVHTPSCVRFMICVNVRCLHMCMPTHMCASIMCTSVHAPSCVWVYTCVYALLTSNVHTHTCANVCFHHKCACLPDVCRCVPYMCIHMHMCSSMCVYRPAHVCTCLRHALYVFVHVCACDGGGHRYLQWIRKGEAPEGA